MLGHVVMTVSYSRESRVRGTLAERWRKVTF